MEKNLEKLLGKYVLINEQIYISVAATDQTTVTFHPVASKPCPTCGEFSKRTYIIGSLNYRNEVRPIDTIPPHP